MIYHAHIIAMNKLLPAAFLLFFSFSSTACFSSQSGGGGDAGKGKSFGLPCANGPECETGICLFSGQSGFCSTSCVADGDCPLAYKCLPYQAIATYCQPDGSTCSPECEGRQCGPDGCNGTCGECGQGLTCDTRTGLCVTKCTPSCEGRQCGGDGCNGTCGTCGQAASCNETTGLCEATCVRNCAGKECGADGCNGTCGTCPQGETCDEGRCAQIPEECPAEGCPHGTYCDLASQKCVPGCIDDSGCGAGSICENRTCRAGCREDGDCDRGEICENLQCRSGCRTDSACGAGNICESEQCRAGCRRDNNCDPADFCDKDALTCREGCRNNASCAAPTWCDWSVRDCVECPDAAYEPNDTAADRTQLTATQDQGEQDWSLAVCGDGDVDELRASLVYTWSSYQDSLLTLEITEAPDYAATTIHYFIEDYDPAFDEYTEYITGTGSLEIWHSYSGSCMNTCDADNIQITVSSDTELPVKYTLQANVL